jgi:hypothetical protein
MLLAYTFSKEPGQAAHPCGLRKFVSVMQYSTWLCLLLENGMVLLEKQKFYQLEKSKVFTIRRNY